MKNSSKRVVDKATNQGMLLLQPYFAMGLIEAMTIIMWLIASYADYTREIALALSASTIILSFFIWKTSQHRREFGRGHAISTMILAGTYVVVATIFSPFNPTVLLAWLLGGMTIALSWNIRHVIRAEGRENLIEIFLREKGLGGTKMNFTKRTGDIVEGQFHLKPGLTQEDLQKQKRGIASLLGVPANGVRIRPNIENERDSFFTIVRRDLLKNKIEYKYIPEVLTPNDPITIGWYEDGKPEQFSLHSDSLGAIHMLVQGLNGSGKSEAAKVIFAECFKRTEMEMWVIDTTKGEQTLGVVRDYLDWTITDEKIADLLFKKFPKVIKNRANYLGKKRLSKWEPHCGLSFIYLHVEEASGLIANNPHFIKMMETARSVGIQITASLQRASYQAIDTAARAQFSSVLCFGVNDIEDANFALPDEVIDAGANPAIWRNKRPGYNYLVHPSADDELWITPARTKIISNEVLQEAGEKRLPHELDSVTLSTLGDLYQAELDEDPDNDEEELEELYPEEERADMAEEIEELASEYENISRADQRKKMSPENAKAILDERLEELHANADEFNAPELADVIVITGLSRAWLHKQLQAKVESGELKKEEFTYKFTKKLPRKDEND